MSETNRAPHAGAEVRKCSIGGQALIEGVMMKSPTGVAMVVRKESGDLITAYEDYTPWMKKNKFYALPIVRGCVSFVESLVSGMKAMTFSTSALELEEEEPGKFEIWLSEKLGKGIEQIVIGAAVVLAILLSVGLFFVLPSLIGSFLQHFLPTTSLVNSLSEGLVRMLIFLGYIVAVSRMKDIKRVFMYHGAEHKTIACYEHDLPLTVENCKKQVRLHPRCGTNYLFLVMLISILIYSLIGFKGIWWGRVLTRIVGLPLVAGISYEVLKFAGASDGIVARIVRWPGLQLQRITTLEPDDGQLEVAIQSFELALDPESYYAKHPEQRESADETAPAADRKLPPEAATASPQ